MGIQPVRKYCLSIPKGILRKNVVYRYCRLYVSVKQLLSLTKLKIQQCHAVKNGLNHNQLKGSVKEPNMSIYFFFPPITQRHSISNVLFTGGRGVSDFSVLKYY